LKQLEKDSKGKSPTTTKSPSDEVSNLKKSLEKAEKRLQERADTIAALEKQLRDKDSESDDDTTEKIVELERKVKSEGETVEKLRKELSDKEQEIQKLKDQKSSSKGNGRTK
jgi:chromosome segregation ATPase